MLGVGVERKNRVLKSNVFRVICQRLHVSLPSLSLSYGENYDH